MITKTGRQIMGDIFAEWKKQRFIFSDKSMFPNTSGKYLIILTDVAYWVNNQDDLLDWCAEHDCDTQGMTVDIPDDKTLMLFKLRWT
jgi:hypothetical protein